MKDINQMMFKQRGVNRAKGMAGQNQALLGKNA